MSEVPLCMYCQCGEDHAGLRSSGVQDSGLRSSIVFKTAVGHRWFAVEHRVYGAQRSLLSAVELCVQDQQDCGGRWGV